MEMIESSYDVASIKYHGNQVWPFLRQIYFFQYHRASVGFAPKKKMVSWNNLRRAKNLVYGACNWCGDYDYVLICSVELRRKLGDKYVNKDAEWLIQELGKRRVITVEFSDNGKHFKRSQVAEENVVSGDVFNMVGVLPLISRRDSVENEHILREINERFDLCVDYHWAISSFFRLARAWMSLFRFWKPLTIFVSCYYSMVHQAAVFAANKCRFTVVELQHGRIGAKHFAYNIKRNLDRAFFPTYMFSYGEYVKQTFTADNKFIKRDHVLPVGNGYLEELSRSSHAPGAVKDAICHYDKSVAVTTQWSSERDLIEFIKMSAIRDERIGYVLIPRKFSNAYVDLDLPGNIMLFPDLSFYQIVMCVDFHSSVCSTCALEAPVLGIPNILIDLKGWASLYYGDLLADKTVTRIVSTPEEYVSEIRSWKVSCREDVKRKHGSIYRCDHQDNIRRALTIIQQ